MSTGDDRDRALERLLRTSATGALGAASEACIDAETLGAWAEGTLDSVALRRVEDHLSSCARCQAMAATFARTTPDGASAAPTARRPWARWWLPAAASLAAAATVLWFALPRGAFPTTPAAPAMTMARNEPAPAPPAMPTAEVPEARAASPRAEGAPEPAMSSAGAAAPTASMRDEGAAARPSPSSPAAAKSVAAPTPDRRLGGAAQNNIQMDSIEALPAPAAAGAPAREPARTEPVAPPPSASPPATAPAPSEVVNVAAEAPLIRAQSGERSFAVSSTQVENLPVSHGNFAGLTAVAPGAAPIAEFAARSPSVDAARPDEAGAPTSGRLAGTATATSTRWQILRDGTVLRSTTGGTTWDVIAVDRTLQVVAGAAPSPLVCWLVGPKGVVLLTTDARHFEQLTFPDAVDLTAVRATSERSATVSAADGRAFTTADGGASWRLEPR